jgi:hypothetical protein
MANDGCRDLYIVRLNDPDAVLRDVLASHMVGVGRSDGLDHVRIQQSQSVGATRNFVSHRFRQNDPTQ